MTYKKASQNNQFRAANLRNLSGDSACSVSLKEEILLLRDSLRKIDNEITIEKDRGRRMALGKQKNEMALKMQKLKEQDGHKGRDLGNHFIDVTKEKLTKAMFDLILTEAKQRYDKNSDQMDENNKELKCLPETKNI